MQKKVLVVEDDYDISNLISIVLREVECQADTIGNGSDGLRYAEQNNYDLIILDVMLPKMDGIEVCRELRRKGIQTPVIMLTSKSEEADKIAGLDVGADDYITKPFSIPELLARVKARIRRFSPEKEPSFVGQKTRFMHNGLVLDTERHSVTLNGKAIELTAKEFDLLALFMKNPGRAYTRTQLLDLVWGYSYSGYEHTVNSHINRLRMKIEKDAANPKYVLTVWGVGYKFNDE